jgi:hypothetical protein
MDYRRVNMPMPLVVTAITDLLPPERDDTPRVTQQTSMVPLSTGIASGNLPFYTKSCCR